MIQSSNTTFFRQYDAATPSDLYTALQEAVEESETTGLLPNDLSVSDVLSTWDSIAGYPVVKVERNYDNGEVKFSQSRFLLKSSQVDTSSLWYIPINYATPSSNDFSDISTDFWLTTADATVTFDDLGADDWLIVNKQERGYYRVNYDEDNWRLIIDYLNTADYSKISRLNRAQLIDDSFHLARSGRLNYQYPLELALYLKRETDYIPLFSFFQSLIFVDSRMAASEEYDTFKVSTLKEADICLKKISCKKMSQTKLVCKSKQYCVLELISSLCNMLSIFKFNGVFLNWRNFTSQFSAIRFGATRKRIHQTWYLRIRRRLPLRQTEPHQCPNVALQIRPRRVQRSCARTTAHLEKYWSNHYSQLAVGLLLRSIRNRRSGTLGLPVRTTGNSDGVHVEDKDHKRVGLQRRHNNSRRVGVC